MRFIDYEPVHQSACLNLFDLNCPQYFAVNERADYSQFLSNIPVGYELVEIEQKIVGGFGFSVEKPGIGEIHWILLDPRVKGRGLGKKMIDRVKDLANAAEVEKVKIAASHLSAPFFAKYGATATHKIPNGWGDGMHREDMIMRLKL